MSVTNPLTTTPTRHPTPARYVAAGLAAGIAILYVVVFLVLLPDLTETDNPAPAFLALAVLYAVGALLILWRGTRRLDLVGVAVQVFLVAGYLWLFATSTAHGDDEFFRDNLALGVVITAAQVVLGVLLVLLARSGGAPTGRGPSGRGPTG